MELNQGVYENVINNEIFSEIQRMEGASVKKLPIDKGESPAILSAYLSKLLRQKLEETASAVENVDLVNKLIRDFSKDEENIICDSENFLAEIISSQKMAEQAALKCGTVRPETGFLYSSLFTGRGSKVPLYSEIKKDIESSDEIYFIISFLKLSGLNLIYEDLKRFCSRASPSSRSSRRLTAESRSRRRSSGFSSCRTHKFASPTTRKRNASTQSLTSSSEIPAARRLTSARRTFQNRRRPTALSGTSG